MPAVRPDRVRTLGAATGLLADTGVDQLEVVEVAVGLVVVAVVVVVVAVPARRARRAARCTRPRRADAVLVPPVVHRVLDPGPVLLGLVDGRSRSGPRCSRAAPSRRPARSRCSGRWTAPRRSSPATGTSCPRSRRRSSRSGRGCSPPARSSVLSIVAVGLLDLVVQRAGVAAVVGVDLVAELGHDDEDLVLAGDARSRRTRRRRRRRSTRAALLGLGLAAGDGVRARAAWPRGACRPAGSAGCPSARRSRRRWSSSTGGAATAGD